MPQLPTVSLLKTARHLYKLYLHVKKQEQALPPLLNTLAAAHPEIARSLKRITKYWQLSLIVVCESLYGLMGKKLSEAEHERIVLLSIFGPFYDDLFDDAIISFETIEAFTLHPEKHHPSTPEEAVIQAIYLRLLELSPDRNRVISHLHDVFIWQKASLRQMQSDITEEELYDITYKKSYYSVLLYYSILDHYPTKAMMEMLYPMAGLFQLTNDAFDVYKDVQNGIYTVPNLYLNFDKIQQKFLADIELFNRSLAKLPFLRPAKEVYGITVHSLHAMGWIALAQLKEVTRGMALADLSRRELVCDMDNLPQKMKWVRQVKYLVNYQ